MATSAVDKSIKLWDIRKLSGPLQHYKLRGCPTSLSLSHKSDMMAVGMGNIVEVYRYLAYFMYTLYLFNYFYLYNNYVLGILLLNLLCDHIYAIEWKHLCKHYNFVLMRIYWVFLLQKASHHY